MLNNLICTISRMEYATDVVLQTVKADNIELVKLSIVLS